LNLESANNKIDLKALKEGIFPMPFFNTIKLLLLTCSIAMFQSGFTQNLVANPGFEEHSYCPPDINQGELQLIKEWRQSTSGTPDYFHRCSRDVGIPNSIFGTRESAEGDAFLGLVVFSPTKRNYREYMHARLLSPLRKDEWYCVSMKVALAENSTYATDGIGAALTAGPFKKGRGMNLTAAAQLMNPEGNVLYFQQDWFLLQAPMKSKGGEQFITVGNFRDDEHLQVKSRNIVPTRGKAIEHAYYFVDDVSVVQIENAEACDNTLNNMRFEMNADVNRDYRTIRLQSVLFDFDEDKINKDSEAILAEVLLVLKRSPTYEVEVVGHTDILGREGYNIDLSKRRSQSVIHYLNSRGIDQNRLRIKYFGSTQPVTTNETEEGRQQNRRVEFMIVEKEYEEFSR
jgi:outer membrane protein OmpA-like peptidoglycan-associated protein